MMPSRTVLQHTAQPSTAPTEHTEEPWTVLLFDDPVNTMEYVSFALRAVLDLSAGEAERLMLEAHTTGHAAVFAGDREEAERVCVALHTWSLHATVAR